MATEVEAQLKSLMSQPPNQVCADCSAPKPRFASITLAIFLCNRCYGIHRGVGAHITRTKCVGLDRWSPQEVHRMRSIGNAAASAYWEKTVPPGFRRPTPASPDQEVEKWIRDKYEKRLYCPQDSPPPSATGSQFNSIQLQNIHRIPSPQQEYPSTSVESSQEEWKPFG